MNENKLSDNYEANLINFAGRAIQARSYSNEEGNFANLIMEEMKALDFDEVFLDTAGNVVGRVGNGQKIIHFDSHMDTVEVNDEALWDVPPFEGRVADGNLWGRGSVDMKSALCASVYAAALAKKNNYLEGKTIYVTATVCEEYCDGENLKMLYKEFNLKPDCCIICEPSGNEIALGHKGKAQIRITTNGVSAHGSAPEKGINAVYEMAEIISRVDALNKSLSEKEGSHGTVVLSDISCVSASLNAVPSSCSIYLDRRLALGENTEDVKQEMDELIAGKDAFWEVGTLHHTSWNGAKLVYEPMHNPWIIEKSHPLASAMNKAYESVYEKAPEEYVFWDFGTNAITPVAMGIPVIGFGPGDYKLAHMRNEHCPVQQISDACKVYLKLIEIY